MASTDPTNNNSPSHSRRRSSFTVSELLAAHRATSTTDTSHSVRNANPAMTSAVTQAAQQPHARRLSITTLGLSGSGGSASSADPVSGRPGRSNSILEAAGIRKGVNRHASISEHEHESAVVDDMDTVSPPSGGSMGRRLSSGAKAYRDVRTTSAGNSMLPGFPGGQQSPNGTVKTQGFNWSENLRSRAQRTSISAGAGDSMASAHARTRSTAASEPIMPAPAPASAPAPAPPVVAPPAPTPPKARGLFEFEGGKPDPMQERILRGQFHMD